MAPTGDYDSQYDYETSEVAGLAKVWETLWAIMSQYIPRARQRWVYSKIVEQMADQLAAGRLESIDLSHPWFSLGDRGLVLVARWLRDFNELFEGPVRRVDVSGHSAGRDGLKAIAEALPQSTIEVDVRGNTGPSSAGGGRAPPSDWGEGVLAIVRALRKRGGGYVLCGRAHADEAERLARTLRREPMGQGVGDVVVTVAQYGAADRDIEVGNFSVQSKLSFAPPDWTQALLGPTDEAPYHYRLQPHDAFYFQPPVERIVFGRGPGD